MTVRTQIADGVATLTLDHPPLNILTRAVIAELVQALATVAADPTARVAVLCATGKHFSAGADVGEHLPPQYRELIPEFMDAVTSLASFPLPLIAAVRGRCLGGGCELVLTADVIVAGEGASFGQPEILLGVTAPAACVLLPRVAQHGLAAELLFTGDAVSAMRARQGGLVQHVVADDRVEAEAAALAHRMARHSGAALRAAKRSLHAGASRPLAGALHEAGRIYVDEVMATEDALEGLNAFTEKRAAAWRNR